MEEFENLPVPEINITESKYISFFKGCKDYSSLLHNIFTDLHRNTQKIVLQRSKCPADVVIDTTYCVHTRFNRAKLKHLVYDLELVGTCYYLVFSEQRVTYDDLCKMLPKDASYTIVLYTELF